RPVRLGTLQPPRDLRIAPTLEVGGRGTSGLDAFVLTSRKREEVDNSSPRSIFFSDPSDF
ncbi:MAG TPA: hypothetical protein PLH31_12770, partial [Caulobacter sp.]|nr:hypothetical protein [Caulobacter sp.]